MWSSSGEPGYDASVPRAYTLKYSTLDGSVQGERRFNALPIRIGRNALNDCCLALGFVSDFHARIEEVDGRICVRDLQSTNGVLVGQNQRLARQVPTDLAQYSYEFFIGPLMRMKLEITQQHEQRVIGSRNPNLQMTVLGNPDIMQLDPRAPQPAPAANLPTGQRPSIAAWQTPPIPQVPPGQAVVPQRGQVLHRPVSGAPSAPPGPPPGISELPGIPSGPGGGEPGAMWPSQQMGVVPPLPPLPSKASEHPGEGPAPLPNFAASPAPNMANALAGPGNSYVPPHHLPTGPGIPRPGRMPSLPGLPNSPNAPGGPGGAPAGIASLPGLPNADASAGLPGLANAGGRASVQPIASPGAGPYPGFSGYSNPRMPATGETGRYTDIAQELLAFIGLQELATSLLPGMPLETKGDIARLVTKLHDAVEVFTRCFIPLRDGHAQFISSMDLQKGIAQRTMHRSAAFLRVEMARDPATLAATLLDFRDPSPDAVCAIEGVFADLMLHQLGLLEGVMQGVRALLDEISPDAIEKAVDQEGGNSFGFGRNKALWQAYRERYEQLSEEKEAFARIFGPEFTQSYREFQRRRSGSGGNR